MITINVLKSERREKGKKKGIIAGGESEKKATNIFALVLLVVVLLIAYLWWSQNSTLEEYRTEVANLDARKKSADLQNVEQRLAELEKTQQIILKKIEIIDQLQKYRTVPVEVLDMISRLLPDQLWLSSLKYASGAVSITGLSFSNELIAKFITAMEESGKFGDMNLISSNKIDRNGVDLYQFQLNFKYLIKQ